MYSPNYSRQDIIANVAEFIVIDDGAYRYPVDRDDLPGTTIDQLRAMDGESYSAWCSEHPCVALYSVGSGDMVDLCNDMVDAGAEVWHIA